MKRASSKPEPVIYREMRAPNWTQGHNLCSIIHAVSWIRTQQVERLESWAVCGAPSVTLLPESQSKAARPCASLKAFWCNVYSIYGCCFLSVWDLFGSEFHCFCTGTVFSVLSSFVYLQFFALDVCWLLIFIFYFFFCVWLLLAFFWWVTFCPLTGFCVSVFTFQEGS